MAIDFSYNPEKQSSGDIDFSYNPAAGGLSARAKKQNKGFLADTATDAKRGIEQLPGMATGLVDLVNPLTYVTGKRMADDAANWVGEKTGFQPSKWEKQAAEEYSPERQASDKAINDAWENGSASDIAGSYLSNPRSIAGVIGQSAPSMLAGGGIARLGLKSMAAIGGTDLAALRASAAAGDVAAADKLNRLATTAGAVGEGAVTAGQNMDQVSRDVDPALAAGTSLAAGAITGLIGKTSGRVANKLGIPDFETSMAGGGAGTSSMSLSKRIAAGATQEGLLQEAPQSAQEQMWQNVAEGKPLDEGVARQAVEGTLAGIAMGGGIALRPGNKAAPKVDDTKPAADEVPPAADGLTYQPGLIPGVDVGEQKQATIPASDMPVVDFQKSPVYGPTAPVSRADEMQGIDFTTEPKLQETGPMSSAVNVGVDSGATSLRPQGSFSDMSEFANLLGQEQQDVQSRRTGIAHRQALQREVALQDADQRVADQMAKEAAQRRRAVLDQVLSDPTTQNPAERFSAELKRQGFRDSTPNADELATVQRFNDIKSAEPVGPEIEPSLPNEVDAEQLGIRSRKGSSGAQSSGRDKVAEVRQLVADGWKISNKTLVSPTGKKRILNTAEHAAAKEATRERNLAAMERYRQSNGKGTPVSTTNAASEETNAPEIEQLAPQTVQANDAQVEPQPSAAPQAEGVEQPEPAEAAPTIAQSDVEDYGKRVVRRKKPGTPDVVDVKDVYGRTHRVKQADLDGGLDRIPTIRKNGDVVSGEEIPRSIIKSDAATESKQPNDPASAGQYSDENRRALYLDMKEKLMRGEVTLQEGQRAMAKFDEEAEAEKESAESKPPEMSKSEQRAVDAIQSALYVAAGEGVAEAEVMAELGAKNEEVGQAERSNQESQVGNDVGSKEPARSGDEERDGDAQGQEREVIEPQAKDYTPKQFHEAKLKYIANSNGVSMVEVREMYDTDAGRKESEREWVDQIRQEFKIGNQLSRQMLDKLEEVRPGAVSSFAHDYPESKIPNGYQIPSARKIEQNKQDERKADRKAVKGEREVTADGRVSSEAKQSKQDQISDFGEKLEGAKKDLWKSYKKAMSDELPADAKEITLSKHFPEPDYENLIASGLDIRAVAAIKAMRDAIPPKPRMSYKVTRWADQLKTLREFANDIITGKQDIDRVISEMRKARGLSELTSSIALYSELGYPAFKNAAGYKVSGGWNKLDENMKVVKEDVFGVTDGRGRVTMFDTRQEAIDSLRAKLRIEPENTGRSIKLDLYKVTSTGDIVIGKKIASNKFIDLKTGFKTAREAREYLKSNEAELLSLLEQKKKLPPTRRSTNDPRVGKDYRQGEDVTPEKFASEFGFRGVQFGNYVEQGRRTKDLNNAYDALLDLANTLGLPPRAISLNGSLGLAFGARGTGGVDPAAAHFEPDEIVINLTKINGAGSLGHEWLHAMDNYFARARNQNDGFISATPYERGAGVRPEVIKAFSDLMKAIKKSDYSTRSAQNDKKRSKDYWSTSEELAARAFESYLISKAEQNGESNDYLANILSEEANRVYNEMAKEFGFDADPYRYPTKAEQKEINPLFDALFSTIQTKETEKGVAMFSRDDVNASRGQGSGMAFRDLQAVVDRVSNGFNNLPKIHVLDSPRDLSDRRDNERTLKEQIEQAGAMDDVEGAHHNGEIYLFASGIASEERAEHVLATHEITHYGLRGTMGKGLDSALQNIWLYNKEVRAKAAVLRMQLGLTSNVSAVEEVLAEMKDSDLVKLKGWRKMVQAFRDWAHKAGFDRIAEKLDGLITKGMSDQEKADLFVANMVNAARDWVRNGKPARGYDPGTSMLGDANFSAKKSDVTDTTAFRKWFGESKVVDAKGEPLVVYHGTRRPFDVFSPSNPRGAIGNQKGVYFTADKSVAEEYAQDVDGAWDDKSRVIAAYIKIENDADGKTIDSAYRGREYVVFKPENIKSATGNNGDFDASNPDIRFSRNKSASVDASITEIFDGLAGRGLKKVRAEERLAEHPQAESIRYVQDNILDILEELEGAGTIKINC